MVRKLIDSHRPVFSRGASSVGASGSRHLIVTVRSGTGPVAGAEVTAGGFKGITGADGSVRLSVPAGSVDVVVTRDDFDPGAAHVELRAGSESRIDIDLAPASEFGEKRHRQRDANWSAHRRHPAPCGGRRQRRSARKDRNGARLMSPCCWPETNGLRIQTTSPALGGASLRIQGLSGRYSQVLADGLPLLRRAVWIPLASCRFHRWTSVRSKVIKGVASALYGMSADWRRRQPRLPPAGNR
jgi:hypothetical protein